MDLPRGSTPSWGRCSRSSRGEESYREKHGVAEDEGRVLRFLLGDKDHLSRFARPLPLLGQMPGVFRKFSPRAWEDINGLYHFSLSNCKWL